MNPNRALPYRPSLMACAALLLGMRAFPTMAQDVYDPPPGSNYNGANGPPGGNGSDGGNASAIAEPPYSGYATGGNGGDGEALWEPNDSGSSSFVMAGNAGNGGVATAGGESAWATAGYGGSCGVDANGAGNGNGGNGGAAGALGVSGGNAYGGNGGNGGGGIYAYIGPGYNGGNGGNGGNSTAYATGVTSSTVIGATAVAGSGGGAGGVVGDATTAASTGNSGNGGGAYANATDDDALNGISVGATATGGSGAEVGGIANGLVRGLTWQFTVGTPGFGGSAIASASGDSPLGVTAQATATGGEGGSCTDGGDAASGGVAGADAEADSTGPYNTYASATANGGAGGSVYSTPIGEDDSGDIIWGSNGSAGIDGIASALATAISAGGTCTAVAAADGNTSTMTAIDYAVSDEGGGGDAVRNSHGLVFSPADVITTLVIQQTLTATNAGGTAYASISGGADSQITLGPSGQTDNEGTLTIAGVGSPSIAGITGGGSLIIGDGTNAVTLTLASNSGASTQSSITVNSGSSLDIRNNTFIINYSGSDPVSTIKSYLSSAYNSGAWTGTGITSSSVVAANDSGSLVYGVGYADGADGIVPGLSSGEIEILPTLAGDCTLQGTVDFGDLQILEEYYGHSGGWDHGNFRYGSTINFGDYEVLEGNYGDTASLSEGEFAVMNQFANQNGDELVANANGVGFTLVSVPEPASCGMIGLAATGILGRRRRRIRR